MCVAYVSVVHACVLPTGGCADSGVVWVFVSLGDLERECHGESASCRVFGVSSEVRIGGPSEVSVACSVFFLGAGLVSGAGARLFFGGFVRLRVGVLGGVVGGLGCWGVLGCVEGVLVGF